MPKIGDLITLKVDKVVGYGAFLSKEGDRNRYFIHIKEVSDGWVKSLKSVLKEGETRRFRLIGVRRHKNKKTFQVSLRSVDDNKYKKERFNKELDKFLKISTEKQTQIRKNRDRKMNNNRKLKRKK